MKPIHPETKKALLKMAIAFAACICYELIPRSISWREWCLVPVLIIIGIAVFSVGRCFYTGTLPVFLSVLLAWQPCEAQTAATPAVGTEFMIHASMPDVPGQERNNLVAGICVVGIVALGAYAVLKVVSACRKAQERRDAAMSNAAASPLPFQMTAEETHALIGDPPVVTGPTPSGTDCGCDDPVPAGERLPIIVEHSTDMREWRTAGFNIAVGEEIALPSDGFWRISPMRLQIDRLAAGTGALLTVPPGVLEWSDDLSTWLPIATNSMLATYQLVNAPGFYRVRNN